MWDEEIFVVKAVGSAGCSLLTLRWSFYTGHLGKKEGREPRSSVCMNFAWNAVFWVAVLFILDFLFSGKKNIWF